MATDEEVAQALKDQIKRVASGVEEFREGEDSARYSDPLKLAKALEIMKKLDADTTQDRTTFSFLR